MTACMTLVSRDALDAMTQTELEAMVFSDARSCMKDYDGPLKYHQSEHAKVRIGGQEIDLHKNGLVAFIVEEGDG